MFNVCLTFVVQCIAKPELYYVTYSFRGQKIYAKALQFYGMGFDWVLIRAWVWSVDRCVGQTLKSAKIRCGDESWDLSLVRPTGPR